MWVQSKRFCSTPGKTEVFHEAFFFLFVLLFVVVQSFAWTEAAADKALYEDAIHTARREIWKTLSSGKASSATIAFMDDGKIVYSEGFGMRDRENALPVERNTQFNIGSISKIFTAAAILLLVDDGRVELDKPVTTYLPDFTTQDERYKDITVRMLLNHTSGFPGTNGKDGFGSKKNPNYVSETLSYLAADGLKHTPGEISVYCNDGFTVAEAVIEAASGMSYADFLMKRIFKPMKMRNSSCFFKDGNTNIALVYNPETGLAMPVEYVSVMGFRRDLLNPGGSVPIFDRPLPEPAFFGTILFPSIPRPSTVPRPPSAARPGSIAALVGIPWPSINLPNKG